MAQQRVDLATLLAFEAKIRERIPGFSVRFKDESWLQKVLGFVSYPFNPKFMSFYTTTLGNTVWFPTRAFYEEQPRSSFGVLAHELVHLEDERTMGLLMPLGIIFPQVLGLIPLLAYLVFARLDALAVYGILFGGMLLSLSFARISMGLFSVLLTATLLGTGVYAALSTGWLACCLLAGIAALAPWPSPTRTALELRGYAMQVGLFQWVTGNVPATLRDAILQQFTGSGYYYMSWDQEGMTARIEAVALRARMGELQKGTPYNFVHEFCVENHLVDDSTPEV